MDLILLGGILLLLVFLTLFAYSHGRGSGFIEGLNFGYSMSVAVIENYFKTKLPTLQEVFKSLYENVDGEVPEVWEDGEGTV